MKLPHWMQRPSLPMVVLLECSVLVGGMLLVTNFLMFRAPEQKQEISSFMLGDIRVTDVRTGTEFNRILEFPNGRVVVESGWVNHWGEHQIRIIGPNHE